MITSGHELVASAIAAWSARAATAEAQSGSVTDSVSVMLKATRALFAPADNEAGRFITAADDDIKKEKKKEKKKE